MAIAPKIMLGVVNPNILSISTFVNTHLADILALKYLKKFRFPDNKNVSLKADKHMTFLRAI